MLSVEFISTESDKDLIVSFALAPAAHDSLTLLRSPQYELLLPEDERGISVSTLDPSDYERDMLRSVRWSGSKVTVKTERHEYKLDVSRVSDEDIAEARVVLRKMVADGAALFECA